MLISIKSSQTLWIPRGPDSFEKKFSGTSEIRVLTKTTIIWGTFDFQK